jgi:hypothetical protein
MILSAFTFFHVVISLMGIGSGFLVVYGMLSSKRWDGWTALFLTTTVATSVTGFLFPAHRFTPGHAVGILSLVLLTFSILGRYRFGPAGGWRRTYAITAVTALYLNVFVLIVQLFEKVPSLRALAPTQSEPPFQVTQLSVLVIFAVLAVLAPIKFHVEPPPAARWVAHPASSRD